MNENETRLFEDIRLLTQKRGVSGSEDEVREAILALARPFADSLRVDALGSVIAEKKGRARAAHRLLLTAHMDEVGFTVTHIEGNGMLRFAPVGGVSPAVSSAREVQVGPQALPGVIGAVPIHLEEKEALEAFVKYDKKLIDVGAKTRAEAEEKVCLGDMVTFVGPYRALGGGKFASKAIDDRAGCALLLALLRSELLCDCSFAFTVQEETGLAGARTVGFALRPEFAFAVESTTAADLPGVPGDRQVCRQGKGPVISFMDRGTIYPQAEYRRAAAAADALGLPWQTKEMIAGGNECRALSTSADGIRVLAVSLPARYIHSPFAVCDSADVLSTFALLGGLIGEFGTK